MSLEKGKISTTCTVPASTSMELLLRNLTARLDEISGRMKKLEKDVTKAIDAIEDLWPTPSSPHFLQTNS